MSDTIEVQDNLPGWLFTAARSACGISFLELSEEASVSTSWMQKIERMPAIGLRQSRGRGSAGIERESIARVLNVFERHGLELRGAAGGHPAMLICNDPAALEAVRAANGKSVDAGA